MTSKDLFEYHIDKALREDPTHFGKRVVIEAFEKAQEQVKNNDLLHSVSGWLEFYGNEDLFNEMANRNCPCRFLDGSQCRYNDNHPIAELTHFKIV